VGSQSQLLGGNFRLSFSYGSRASLSLDGSIDRTSVDYRKWNQSSTSPKILPGSKEVGPVVVTHDPVNYPPTAAQNLNRQEHNKAQVSRQSLSLADQSRASLTKRLTRDSGEMKESPVSRS